MPNSVHCQTTMKSFIPLALLLTSVHVTTAGSAAHRCFCQVTGTLDDCACDVETIDRFNNKEIFPKLQKLLSSDYFRFYKVNLNNPCPFWTDHSQCGLKYCAVKPCTLGEVPEGLKSSSYKVLERIPIIIQFLALFVQVLSLNVCPCSDETRQALQEWKKHDDESDRFCMLDDEDSPKSQYVDLLLNPERFTGYKGPEAWRIWNSIYEENCFNLFLIKGQGFYRWLEGLCVEKRAFFRLISGLHASINIHLSARYLLDENWFEMKWGHNVSEFQLRFDKELTEGEGPKRLRNLYFLYLIELRALAKILPYFERPAFHLYTGQHTQDNENKKLLLELLHVAKSFPLHFDETALFAGNNKEAMKLKEDFKLTFKNISRIMDCVECFKCRLWGKLQTQGLGSALKILFSERQIDAMPNTSNTNPSFQLSRQEIVSLFNAFGRISTSVRELENFRSLLSNLKQ
uniref:ERO1-like protein alpha n=1 Tax=Sinocyclocheilus anshuiensis TaxID=1608454 RepID=A0A671M156_9TELE